MRTSLLKKPFFYVLLWFCAGVSSIAQTPAADLDSITEDSYHRMLRRQEAEQHLDSLRLNHSQLELAKSSLKNEQKYYYAASSLIIIGLFVVLWYFRQLSIFNKKFKKQ